MRAKLMSKLAAAVSVVVLAGCASEGADLPPLPPSASVSQTYRLGAGDKLQIVLYGAGAAVLGQNGGAPDLTAQSTVSDDGSVGAPLVGEMPAGGLTVQQLQVEISKKLAAGYLKDPKVGIDVLAYRPFYIIGEVNHPGSYPYANSSSVLAAVALAGGYTYRANEKFAVIERTQDGSILTRRADLGSPILPGDIIRIPERYF